MDEDGVVTRNKARLVAQGFTQLEGLDYDETFAPVARLEAIRLFLAYASFKNFIVFQMDVKTAFLHVTSSKKFFLNSPLALKTRTSQIMSIDWIKLFMA